MTGFSKIRNEALAKALNYMRLMEEWGSGLKRVNDVLGEYGLQKVTIEDVGFAVRMNVYRNNALDSKVVKFGKSAEKHAGEGVNEGVSEGVSNVYEEIRRNPGIRTPSLVKAVGGSQASIERAIAKLKRLQKIVYRGAPKTGGYYCI